MAIGLYIWALKNRIILFLLAILVSCQLPKHSENAENNRALYQDKLHNGMLVCRLGTGNFSEYFKKYASKEKKYSHIGIISKERDTLFVYHSEASEFTGIGYVKRETLSSFLNGVKVFDFFEFKFADTTKNKILNNVKHYYFSKTPFDLDFNSFKDDKVYCSELIAISINKTLHKNAILPHLNLNGLQLYGLDDIYLNDNVKPVILTNN